MGSMLPESYLGRRQPCFLDEGGAKEERAALTRAGRRGGEKNRPPKNGSGVTESCVSLRTKMVNMPIVSRWGIMMGNHWRVFFFLFPKKSKMGKWDRELLEMLLGF